MVHGPGRCAREGAAYSTPQRNTASEDQGLKPGRTLVNLAGFRREATEILGLPVDVATADMLKEGIRDEAIGEALPIRAATSKSSETRQSAPEIPWADIAGLRDLIAHEYFRIDIHRVLEIVERDLPPLESTVDRILAE